MNTIYSFHSHDLRLVEHQIAKIKEHCKEELYEIVIVQGPFGANGMTSAGICRIHRGVGEEHGFRTITAPETFAGMTMPIRFYRICDWVWMEHKGEDDKVMFMHGDNIPHADFDFDELLAGKPVAGASYPKDNKIHTVPVSWLLFDKTVFKSVHGFNSYGVDTDGEWMGHDMSCVVPDMIKVAQENNPERHWTSTKDEWFLNLGRQSGMWESHSFFEAKLVYFDMEDCRAEPKWIDWLRNQIKHDPASHPSAFECKHRGEELKEEDCTTCGKRVVPIKIYSCGILEECTLKKDMGRQVCINCNKREV